MVQLSTKFFIKIVFGMRVYTNKKIKIKYTLLKINKLIEDVESIYFYLNK